MGNKVYYLAYDHKHWYLVEANTQKKTVISNLKIHKPNLYLHTKAFWDMYKNACSVVNKQGFDLVYMRNHPFSHSAVKLFKILKKKSIPTVIEIPTFPPEREAAGKKSVIRKVYGTYSKLCREKIEKNLSLYVLIGDKADSYHGVPAINIDNGTDTSLLPIRNYHTPTLPYHLIGVAAMSKWHGYDRLIKGISELNEADKKKIIFDVVGSEGDGSLASWKQLVKELSLEKQVVFHGYKTGDELNDLFDKADCGISALAFHRTGFYSGSVLKLREYSTRGLPFVYANDDPALTEELKFCIKFANDDTPIDVNMVIKFIESLKDNTITPQEIRNYAEEHMTWQKQFEKVFNALGI